MKNFFRGSKARHVPLELILPIAFFLAIASYRLFQLPGAWYGDISIGHEYVQAILEGKRPFSFSEGAGPVYHYLITPIVVLFGQSFETYKIASVTVGAIGLLCMYLLVRELVSRRVAFFAAIIASLSFWYISWTRTGSTPVMAAPILSSLTVLGAVRFRKYHRLRDILVGSVTSSLGLFTHPSTFLLPLVFLALLTWDTVFLHKKKREWFSLAVAFACFLPAALLFSHVIFQQKALFLDPNGYIGKKVIDVVKEDPKTIATRTATYMLRTALMLHVRGDATFRYNVPGSPQLDVVSGLFFILGMWYWFSRQRRSGAHYVFIPLVLLLLPSVVPTAPSAEVPSMTRTFVAIPFIFLVIAGGIDIAYRLIARRSRRTAWAIIGIFIIFVGAINITKYFVFYPQSLPNRNAAFDKIIATHIDALPQTTRVYLTSCCWGDWGEPEPKAIYYRLARNVGREGLVTEPFIRSCGEIPSVRPIELIIRPDDTPFIEKIRSCFPGGVGVLHKDSLGQSVFYSFLISDTKYAE